LGFPNRFHNNCQQDCLAPSPEHHQVAMEENLRAMENDQKLMFMDTTHMYEKQKAYVDICREKVLRLKQQAMGVWIMAT
jgi:hypothetical protein